MFSYLISTTVHGVMCIYVDEVLIMRLHLQHPPVNDYNKCIIM